MCRIAGLIAPDLPAETIKQKVTTMCEAQQHGGPDDSGMFIDEQIGLAFGHRRLSIIDLSVNGHQPMSDVNNKAYITFNGEIYNYRELRSELKNLGAQFKSDSDTEVIIQAYLNWGTASFAKLKGIFAFGLFDKERQTTYLVRDSKGVKPLYYSTVSGSLAFASEVRALKAAKIADEDDPNWPVRFLAFGNIPEPFTTLKAVHSLPKNNYLSWDHQSSTHQILSYKFSSTSTVITDDQQAKQTVNNSLRKAVDRQLIADAPIGVFLSGGIDSSLIALLANKQKHAQLNTVSIHFEQPAYDESRYQSVIKERIEGQKFGHVVRQSDFDEHFDKVMQAMDMPTTDGINTWFISYFARKDGLKAVLSGIGGDELFGGYPSFKRIKYISWLRGLPAGILTALAKTGDCFKRLTYLKYKHYLADYLFLRGIFSIEEIALLTEKSTDQVANVLFGDAEDHDLGGYDQFQASWLETNLYLQNQLLRDTDVMGMAHGLEIRVPFLDEDFCEVVDSIAANTRFQKRPKGLLIDSFDGLLPQEVWSRPKMGFTFPLRQWLKQSEVANKDVYQNAFAKDVIDQFINNKLHWSKAFALYQVKQYA